MNPSLPLEEWLKIAQEAALLGGAILKQLFGHLHTIEEKGRSGDLVTEADRGSEEVIIKHLTHYCPTHQILAEESGLSHSPSEFIWAVDPLDGTTNYAHQYPMAAVSIGLLHKQKPILGVIYNPFSEELYTAAKGLGAKLNQTPIQVSCIKDLEKSLLATGFAYDRRETPDNNYAEFCHFTHITQGVRRAGAASLDLAYVACGRIDGYWERGLKPWDIAAGAIIVEEAGGMVSAYDSTEMDIKSGSILTSNGHIHREMSNILSKKV